MQSLNARLNGDCFSQPTNHIRELAPMLTSQERQFFSELAAGHAGPTIPEAKRVYFQTRLRNKIFDFIVGRFVREQKRGLTKAVLARRIGKSPEVINRWLGAPSNLTTDTISDLLLGICAEEMIPQSESLLVQQPRNWAPANWINEGWQLNFEPQEPKGTTTTVDLETARTVDWPIFKKAS
jgi:hypothetical protein